MRKLRILLIATLLACTGLVLPVAPAAHAEAVYPPCYVKTTYGTGTLTPGKVGVGYGTGELTLKADYVDSYNRYPDYFAYEYENKAAYKAGAESANYETVMSVNGVSLSVSPHPNRTPGYFLHGAWAGGWKDSLGLWHPWQKGDRITVRVKVDFYPTFHNGVTEGSCIL